MANGLQKAIDICFIMFDPRLPSGNGAQGRAFNRSAFLFRRWIIGILWNDDIINSIFDDLCQEMFKPRELRRKTAMEFLTVRVLAFPAFDHNIGFFAVIASHYAGNLIAVLESGATNRTGRFLPITQSEKLQVSRCKQDRNLIR